MSKNFTAKTSPKWILWSVITAVIVLIGVVIMAIFGVNNAVSTQPCQKLVVNVQMANTFYEEERGDIEDICEQAIADAGLKAIAVSYDDLSTSEHELVYSFDPDVELTALKDALQAELRAAYPDQDFATMSYKQNVLENLPGGYTAFLVRNILAGAVMAVLAFAYVSLRYKLWNGITAFVSAVATVAIACGLVVATRIVITSSVMYGVLFAELVSLALSVLFAAKAEAAEKKNGALTDAETVSEAVPVCDTIKLCGGIAVALLAVGIVGIFCAANFAWFALVAALGLLSAVYSSLLLAPSVFLALRKPFAKAAAEKARYDYKKGVKKAKKEEASEGAKEE